MTSVMIERGLKLIDAAQVGERSFRARTNLAGSPDRLRQVAVRICDLDRRHDHDGSNQEGRNQSTACVQPTNLFAEARVRASQASSRCRPTMHASPT